MDIDKTEIARLVSKMRRVLAEDGRLQEQMLAFFIYALSADREAARQETVAAERSDDISRILVHFLEMILSEGIEDTLAMDLGRDMQAPGFDEALARSGQTYDQIRTLGLTASGALTAMLRQGVEGARADGLERREIMEILALALSEESGQLPSAAQAAPDQDMRKEA